MAFDLHDVVLYLTRGEGNELTDRQNVREAVAQNLVRFC